MPTVYMLRTPGSKDFKHLTHLIEGRVFDGVSKADAEALVAAGVAEEFDDGNELHVKAVEEFHHLDAKRGVPVVKAVAPAKAAEPDESGKGKK